jgi:hypothetical protein
MRGVALHPASSPVRCIKQHGNNRDAMQLAIEVMPITSMLSNMEGAATGGSVRDGGR